MKVAVFFAGVFGMGMLAVSASRLAAEPTLNYQGRLTAGGSNYTGPGYFKFMLHDGAGNPFWSNETVVVEVNYGLFNVDLGDTARAGMSRIPPVVFHEPNLWLRTWFSTNGMAFEQLTPDIRIRPSDLAHINTGNLLIVDDEGHGDFDNVQEAIDAVAADPFRYSEGILIMPGWYVLNEPLRFPTNRAIQLRGVGAHAWNVSLFSSTGAVLLLEPQVNVTLEGISLVGAPAVQDVGGVSWRGLQARSCQFRRSPGSGEGPVVALSGDGTHVTLRECEIANDNAGTALALGGRAFVSVVAGQLWTQDEGASAFQISGEGRCELKDCAFWGSGRSLWVVDGSGYGDFSRCRFQNDILITNGSFGAQWTDCTFGASVGFYGLAGGGLTFANCQFGYREGVNRVRAVGGQAHLRFNDCSLRARGASTFYAQDWAGYIQMGNTEMQATDAAALELVATTAMTPGSEISAVLRNCILRAERDGVEDSDAVVLRNDPANAEQGIEINLEFQGCRVWGEIRDGIGCEGGGIEVNIANSEVEGVRHGLFATNRIELDVVSSAVSGENGDAVHLVGAGMLFARAADLWADGEGRGLYLSLSAGEGLAIVGNTVVGSTEGAALECDSGKLLVNHSWLVSGNGPMVKLAGTNCNARFSHCLLTSAADLMGFSSTNAAVTLYGTTGQTPVPTFLMCTFEPSASAPYAIDLQGGATTGGVFMANSVLTAPLHPNIGKMFMPPQDTYGNVILTTP